MSRQSIQPGGLLLQAPCRHRPGRPHGLCALLLLLALLLSGCSQGRASEKIRSIEDLNRRSRVIGGLTGSAHEPLIAQVFPLAAEKQYPGFSEMLLALDHGQIDALVHARESLESAMEENPGAYPSALPLPIITGCSSGPRGSPPA